MYVPQAMAPATPLAHTNPLNQPSRPHIRSTLVSAPSRRLQTCILTHSANHVPLNTAANKNEATYAAHEQARERARAAKAQQGVYREDAAAVVGLMQLRQGAGSLSRANLRPVFNH